MRVRSPACPFPGEDPLTGTATLTPPRRRAAGQGEVVAKPRPLDHSPQGGGENAGPPAAAGRKPSAAARIDAGMDVSLQQRLLAWPQWTEAHVLSVCALLICQRCIKCGKQCRQAGHGAGLGLCPGRGSGTLEFDPGPCPAALAGSHVVSLPGPRSRPAGLRCATQAGAGTCDPARLAVVRMPCAGASVR